MLGLLALKALCHQILPATLCAGPCCCAVPGTDDRVALDRMWGWTQRDLRASFFAFLIASIHAEWELSLLFWELLSLIWLPIKLEHFGLFHPPFYCYEG